jgi:predicted DNA-binding transcriptional regulator AlpA
MSYEAMTMQEIVDEVDQTYNMLRNWRRRGQFPDADFYVGRHPRWYRSTIDEWVQRRQPADRPRYPGGRKVQYAYECSYCFHLGRTVIIEHWVQCPKYLKARCA